MLDHTLVCGLVPKDGDALQKAMNETSAAGYNLIHTTCCAIDESNAYYIATFGKPVTEPRRSGIGMTGGGPSPDTPNVASRPLAPSKSS